VFSEPSIMASKLTSLNDLPDEILLKVLSHFGPQDLCLNIAKVCEKWNVLAQDAFYSIHTQSFIYRSIVLPIDSVL